MNQARASAAPSPAGLKARLSALHAASGLGIGVFTAFFPIWLESRGLEASVIGVILAIPMLVRVLVTAPLTGLVDSGAGARRMLLFGYAGMGAAYLALLGAASAPAIAVLVGLSALAQAPIVPTTDLVTIEAARSDPRVEYGRIRVWGSVSYMVASFGAGYLLAGLPADAIVVGLGVLPLLGLLATAAGVRDDAPERPGRRANPPSVRESPLPDALSAGSRRRRLPRSLWYVMAAAACTQASHGAVYGFGSLHWRELGFSEPMIGTLWAIGVVAEIIIFVYLGRLVAGPAGGVRLMMLGSAAAVLRFAGLALDPGLGATLALQALHGLSFGATHLGTMAALSALAPEAARGRAQGMLGTFNALAMVVATVVSGVLYREGGAVAFAAMVPLGAMGLVFSAIALRRIGAQPHRAGEGGRTTPPS